MREGRWCDRGNFPRTSLSVSRLSWPKLAKARSGLVPTFHVSLIVADDQVKNYFQVSRVAVTEAENTCI